MPKDLGKRQKSRRKVRVNRANEFDKELFGKFGSGRGDLSTNRKHILKEKLHGKVGRQ
jgi:hypothetical protein